MLFHYSINYAKKIRPLLIFIATAHFKPNKILNFNVLNPKINNQKNNLFIFY
ncbi:hypothetical protein JOE44_004891 [Chryseobacterium sp. PvR013]|nr:hypothetical protein [Chryseobacterium sp. PvR013]